MCIRDSLDYMEKTAPRCPDTRVYLSLGNKEEKSRHPLMRQVGDNTRRAIGVLEGQLTVPCTLEWNEGGHFDGVSERLCKACLLYTSCPSSSGFWAA